MIDYDTQKLRDIREYYTETCAKHNVTHLENDPCSECYDRHQKAKELMRLRAYYRMKFRLDLQNRIFHDAFSGLGDAYKLGRDIGEGKA